jgi:hypothetical protein
VKRNIAIGVVTIDVSDGSESRKCGASLSPNFSKVINRFTISEASISLNTQTVHFIASSDQNK